MKQFLSFIRKEFYHIFRDARTLMLLLLMPVALLIIFGFAISTEIKNNNIAVLDMAHDVSSQNIINRLNASVYFKVVNQIQNASAIQQVFKKNLATLVIVFPENFNKTLESTNSAQIQIIADGSDPNTATTLINYASSIISKYQTELMNDAKLPYQIVPEVRMLYNPELKSAYTFVPGVMGLILMLISTMMTSVSIVKEKELGTMEVLLVSPLKPFLFILAKVIPYLIIGFTNVLTILILSVTLLNLPINGNIGLILFECFLFIVASLSLGILISTAAQSQQIAMFISMIGLLLPTMLLSGFIFPVENMPYPLQIISKIVPATWFIIAVKSTMIKGLGLFAVWKETTILLSMALFFLTVALSRFKIRL